MIKRLLFLPVLIVLIGAATAKADISVKTIDFLKIHDISINAAGPLLVQMDNERNRLIVANTLSSSLSIINGETHYVTNIPLEGRALQHLKAEAMTFSPKTGDVYLIGAKCIFIVSPENNTAKTIPTDVQFESIAVDEASGNVFITGRESKSLGFYEARSEQLKMLKWLDRREDLINLNQTPPPPIRKVIADNDLRQIIAIDGFTSSLILFDGGSGNIIKSRQLPLTSGGRWHLPGYNEKDHTLFLVTETDKRKVIEAAKIDVLGENDIVIPLPEFTEGVGIIYNPERDEVYIPYDNFPSVHVADFKDGGTLFEIKIPAYGNDASAIDFEKDLLYVSSWAHGEIDVIDLKERTLQKRITGLGIIPHMFAMAFNSNNHLIYFPKGATAVNGTFGAAICALDPATEHIGKIYTGWAPVDLIELKNRKSFLVFNSEDQFAEVHADGSYEIHALPYDYPVQAIHNPDGDVYLSYGPHQSYWPTVYIWDAKNGILTIDAKDFSCYDRRIPRQAHKMALDKDGVLYFTQNNWGKEEQYLGTLIDPVRFYEPGKRLRLVDEVEREITQRILKYDAELNRLYLVRTGEKDEDPSLLQVIDPVEEKVIRKIPVGATAADLVFDDENLYISNFDSRSVSIIGKEDTVASDMATEEKPLKLCRLKDKVYVINHASNSLQAVKEKGKVYKIPYEGLPDNLFAWGDDLIITSHSKKALFIIRFNPEKKSFAVLHEEAYPYGDTRFDSRNVSFYLRGQFGDAIFEITKGKTDQNGRLWVTDFLSGKLFILNKH
ncbi:MAG: hypothetical protein GTO42_08725 [Candidatus Latescibacteria bacterium]|nr:hypothetical protein [Candidatus Latescibacterota bacterium]NIO29044.1 hypothetical protein [Candidatus Latescibacterota bacterium]NIO56669.1 hypothetical protein [Candidatus Latescibacterota bacterium]NIT02252.1 hypothetical protein [Candidatus Latescibacterota bacterium]NIT39137.1 hypothetical protein [Candidatus Latescibacterota bacterium]